MQDALNKDKVVKVSRRIRKPCRICKKPLPKDRYFHHPNCVSRWSENYHDIFATVESHFTGKGKRHGV